MTSSSDDYFESKSPYEPTYPPESDEKDNNINDDNDDDDDNEKIGSSSEERKERRSEIATELKMRRLEENKFWLRQFSIESRVPQHCIGANDDKPIRSITQTERLFYDYVTKFQLGLERKRDGRLEEAQSLLFSSLCARIRLRGHDHWTVAECHIFLREVAHEMDDFQSVRLHEMELIRMKANPTRFRFIWEPYVGPKEKEDKPAAAPAAAAAAASMKKPPEVPKKRVSARRLIGTILSPMKGKAGGGEKAAFKAASAVPMAAGSKKEVEKSAGVMVSHRVGAAAASKTKKDDLVGKPSAIGPSTPVESDEFSHFKNRLNAIDLNDRDTRTDIILQNMQQHETDIDVQVYGMSMLWQEHVTSDRDDEIFNVIVSVMKANEDQSEIQYRGCGALWSLATNPTQQQNQDQQDLDPNSSAYKIVNAGACECALTALNKHPAELHVVSTAMGLIKRLSIDGLGRTRLAPMKQTIKAAITSLMVRHAHSNEIQETGCAIFANFAVIYPEIEGEDEAQNFEAEVHAVANALQKQPNDTDVHENAFLALNNYSKLHPKSRAAVASPDVLKCIVDSMNRFDEDESMQDRGCELLWSTAQDEMSRINIAFAGGCDRAVKTLRLFIARSSPNVVQVALGLIQTLSVVEECKIPLLETNVRRDILDAMKTFPQDAQIQSSGCHAFANILFHVDFSGKRVIDVVEHDELLQILNSMRRHPTDKRIQISACIALKNITYLEENVERLIFSSSDVEELLNNAANRFQECSSRVKDIKAKLEKYRRQSEQFAFSYN